MKPVSMWVILGMSLLLVTGATAQPLFGFFDGIAAINKNAPATMTEMPITGKTTPLPGTVPIAGINELLQISLLRQGRLRSIGAQAQAEMPDTSNLNDLVPLVKGQGNVINKLGLTNDNDLIF